METIDLIEALEEGDRVDDICQGIEVTRNDHGESTLNRVLGMSDTLFKSKFRMSKQTFTMLNDEVFKFLGHINYIIGITLIPSSIFLTFFSFLGIQLLTFLRYIANGSFMDIAGDLCVTSKSTAWRSIHRIIKEILRIRNRHIYFPEPSHFANLERQFRSTANFPGVIACVDGTHIPLKVPNNNKAELFRCRKGFKSLNVQMICGLI